VAPNQSQGKRGHEASRTPRPHYYTDFVFSSRIFVHSPGFQLAERADTNSRHRALAASLMMMSQRAERNDEGCPDHSA